jgi:hypothetical protein
MIETLDTHASPISKSSNHSPFPCNTNWTIAISISVNADTRRIFQALTVPEYLEAWIDMPDRTTDSSIIASQDSNGYRLEHYLAEHMNVRIIGSFLYCHYRKMRLHWQRHFQRTRAESLVDFRLRGNFGSSILELRHTALGSLDEFLWHQRLWQGSLSKLTSLLRSA